MVLIVGGVASGKRACARELGFADEMMAAGVIDERPCVYDAQLLAFELARGGYEPQDADELFEALAAKECVIMCEVGSGIVPMERDQRASRELSGRLMGRLAQQASLVVRCVCGLPQVLKGDMDVWRSGVGAGLGPQGAAR